MIPDYTLTFSDAGDNDVSVALSADNEEGLVDPVFIEAYGAMALFHTQMSGPAGIMVMAHVSAGMTYEHGMAFLHHVIVGGHWSTVVAAIEANLEEVEETVFLERLQAAARG